MNKYKQNLRIDNKYVYSYNTKVGIIDHKTREIIVNKYYSVTTSKHINYVANEWGYKVVRRYQQ